MRTFPGNSPEIVPLKPFYKDLTFPKVFTMFFSYIKNCWNLHSNMGFPIALRDICMVPCQIRYKYPILRLRPNQV